MTQEERAKAGAERLKQYWAENGGRRSPSPEAKEKAKQTREKRKNMRDLARLLLEAELTDEDECKDTLEMLGIETTQQAAILWAMMNRAKGGAVDAAQFMRDTSGQKPTDALAVALDDRPFESIDLKKLSTAEIREMIRKREEELGQTK